MSQFSNLKYTDPFHIHGSTVISMVKLTVLINPQRMREGYSTQCVCLCVSLSTLEATLIYSANNGYQWTANDNLFIFKKNENLQIGSFDSETAV